VKWLLLIITIAGVPPLAGWLRRNPGAIPKIWMLVGFLTVEHGPIHLYMAFYTWAGQWPGGVLDGAEIALLDLIIFAIYLSLPRGRHSLPFKFSMIFYFIAVLLSVYQASVPMAALFYCWQLVRIFFVFTVVTKACVDPRVVPSLLKGIAAGLFLATCQAMWQRFGLGILQTGAGFAHQNIIGVISHFIGFPFFALLLAGERGWITKTASLAGILLAALTTSRGTIALTVFGYVVLFIISALRRWTSRKAMIAVTGAIVIGVLAPFIVSSFEKRFNLSGDSTTDFFERDQDRVAMSQAASMILSDHPMGVGANHYVVVASTQGYDAGARVPWNTYGVPVHNVYWLVAAETGYLGIITFVIMLLRPLAVAFLCGWRNRRDQRGDLLLGFSVALLTVNVHSFYEFAFITSEVQYMFAVTVGMVAGLAQQLGYWSRTHAIQIESSDLVRPIAKAAENFRI
jgi:O-antigen ligase